jgi:hypothetical protein
LWLLPDFWPEHIQDAQDYMSQAKAGYSGTDGPAGYKAYRSDCGTDSGYYPTCGFSVHKIASKYSIAPRFNIISFKLME